MLAYSKRRTINKFVVDDTETGIRFNINWKIDIKSFLKILNKMSKEGIPVTEKNLKIRLKKYDKGII